MAPIATPAMAIVTDLSRQFKAIEGVEQLGWVLRLQAIRQHGLNQLVYFSHHAFPLPPANAGFPRLILLQGY